MGICSRNRYNPQLVKSTLVEPIFKKDDRHNAGNYRPVSLTSIHCKMCEHLIAKSIMQHIENHGLMDSLTLRAKCSCETQLLTLVYKLFYGVITKGKQYDIAIMVFSKAFDVVPHTHLL